MSLLAIFFILATFGVSSVNSACIGCTVTFSSYITTIKSTVYNEASATSFLKAFHTTDLGKCIKNDSKSTRPLVNCYLSTALQDFHLQLFLDAGGAGIMGSYSLTSIGYTSSGVFGIVEGSYISTYPAITDLLKLCGTNSTCVTDGIGKQNTFDQFSPFKRPNEIYPKYNRAILLNIKKEILSSLNLRMTDGSTGNEYWEAGGYTSGGVPEALVTGLSGTDNFCWEPITDENGIICWPNCAILCSSSNATTDAQCIKTVCSSSAAFLNISVALTLIISILYVINMY